MTTRYMGNSIEDFQVLELLGKGGFACVYKGQCLTTQQEVAIKMIDKKAMRSLGMVKRVCNEVEIHSQLKHPSILEMYTYFEDDNYVYLVLEMCQNGEVNRFIKKNGGKMSESQARHIMHQLVQGVLYLHSYGIIHRDLTLGNLLLNKNMDVKIADFGLAARLAMPSEKHYTMCGTPNYISPEIATRDPHGLESDVWSMGCMLYTLLVGSPPFDTNAVKSTLNKVVLAKYDMPGYVSPEAKDLISKLLKKNPNDRLTLSGILDHPFMTEKTLPNTLSSPSRHHYSTKYFEQSVDSGQGTMATVSTGIGRSSWSSNGPINKQESAHHGSYNSSNSVDHLSNGWSRNLRQPPSPPVRQRASSSPSSENINTSDRQHLRGTEVANSSSHKNTTKSSDLWLSNLSTSHLPKKRFQEPLVGAVNGKTNSLQNKFRSYDASKYSSYYTNSWTGKGSAQETSSSGFYSANTKLHQEESQTIDKNNNTGTALSTNTYHCGDSLGNQISQHKRHGSDSVSRDADSSEFLPQEKNISPVKPRNAGQEKRERRSRGESKGKSLGDVTEPLNAERLRPIRQKTRNAVVSILEDCEVCLEFIHQDRGQDIVTEVLRISSNGMKIVVYHPNGKDGEPLHSEPSPVPSSPDGHYLFSNLPSKYWKKYKYAVNFVHLVRKLTPRVTLYSKYAKCVLMENSPHPDFEVCFYNGAKVHQSTKCTKIIEPGGVSYTLQSVGGMEGVPLEMRSFLHHVQDAYEKCLKLENTIAQVEQEIHSQQFFPLIVGRRPSRKQSSDKEPTQPKPPAVSTVGTSALPTSPSIAAPASVSLLSFNGTIASTMPNIQQSNIANMHQNKQQSSSRPEASHVKRKTPEIKQKRDKENLNTEFVQNDTKQGISPSAEIFKSTFVEGVGWASQLTSGGVRVQYSDGSQMLVNASEAKVNYTDSQGTVTQYRYSDTFPSVIKTKLANLPFIIESLAKASRTKT
ncbi:serine/threonine-protein kinase PLK4-like [Actinia tenebrosa]|uniref:Serine/threonine-protein kinase PLK4 n=1 Tax=Actinia tenebrosa TaxID=6105 RepID=A0A6P8HMM9_ACTTE|nr:serine/threonine-protein kinase PLK4-like [Actinia tenebrosa]